MSLKDMFMQSGRDELDIDRNVIMLELVDMSIDMEPYRSEVISTLNRYREALNEVWPYSTDAQVLRMSMWTFNEQITVLHDFQPLEKVPVMDGKTYRPDGRTALYDTIWEGFNAVKSFRESLRNQGISTTCIVVVYTNGEDTASKTTFEDVIMEAHKLLEEGYTLVLFGFGDIDAKAIANRIGFPQRHALTGDSSKQTIRHILMMDEWNLLLPYSSSLKD